MEKIMLKTNKKTTLIIGEINYTNFYPIYHHIDRKKLRLHEIELVQDVPSKLNRALENGDIHISGISSFSYGKNFKDYTILPNLSVSSKNQVKSILLFSKVPINDLDQKLIALTTSSETSVNLLKVLLYHFYKITPTFVDQNPDFTKMITEHDACLLIGDDAIQHMDDDRYYRYDLATLWEKFTGFPMTFAVVAVRNNLSRELQKNVSLFYESCLESKKKCQQSKFHDVFARCSSKVDIDASFWKNYFNDCLYFDFGQTEIKSLELYFSLAHHYHLLKEIPTLRLYRPKKVASF